MTLILGWTFVLPFSWVVSTFWSLYRYGWRCLWILKTVFCCRLGTPGPPASSRLQTRKMTSQELARRGNSVCSDHSLPCPCSIHSAAVAVSQASFSSAMLSSSFWVTLRHFQASWDMYSLHHVLGLPQGLHPEGRAQINSKGRHRGSILIRFSNHLSWLFLIPRSSSSTPSG